MSLTRTLAQGACVAIAGFGAQVAFADSISPTSFSANIAVGGAASVHKTVTVTKEVTSGVDIFFMADTTGSMGSQIAAVQASAASLLTSTGVYGGVRWAVGEYKDVGDAYAYRLNTALTSSTVAVTAGIDAWAAGGGGDTPEANLFALETAAGAGPDWGASTAKVMVWFGDAPGHDPSLGSTEASATAALVARNIKVQAIDVGAMNSTGQAGRIAAATGGALFTGIDSAGIAAAIDAAIKSAVTNYTKVCLDTSEAGAAGVAAASTPCYVGTFDRSEDRTFEFDLTFTGLTPGDFSFNTYGTVDGVRVAREADRIHVPEPGSLALLGIAALAGLRARRRSA